MTTWQPPSAFHTPSALQVHVSISAGFTLDLWLPSMDWGGNSVHKAPSTQSQLQKLMYTSMWKLLYFTAVTCLPQTYQAVQIVVIYIKYSDNHCVVLWTLSEGCYTNVKHSSQQFVFCAFLHESDSHFPQQTKSTCWPLKTRFPIWLEGFFHALREA